MIAVLVVRNENEAQRLLPWSCAFAQSDDLGLLVIIAQEREGQREWSEIRIEATAPEIAPSLMDTMKRIANMGHGDDGGRLRDAQRSHSRDVTFRRVRDPHPDRAILDELPKLGAKLLILPLDEPLRGAEKSWKGRLYRSASCETVYLRVPGGAAFVCRKILVPTSGGTNANAAVRRAEAMAKAYDGEVTALYVEAEVDLVAREVGQRVLQRIVKRAASGNPKAIQQKVIVANQLMNGVREAMCEAYDLVLIGAYRDRTIRRIFFGTVSSQLFAGPQAPAFAAVRAGLPFSTRLRQFCEQQIQQFVPQLDRDGRVSLVDRVQSSSHWNFDFVALICLSTCIAALGLVHNQAAVVIGAMLVAPLMTPLVGAGLALVQGNGALIRSALKSVLFGFLLAFLIGFVVGLVALPTGPLPTEIISRTSPGPVDLAVALVGGLAAAYALSRPNLSSALPGVAIAAALVPPIATSGITLAIGEWAFSRGAALLFLTNIVAIILGTAISLWMVGIRDTHPHGSQQQWTRHFAAILLAAIVVIGFLISHGAPKTGQAALEELTRQIAETVADSTPHAELVSVIPTGQMDLQVIVASPEDELGDLAGIIREMAIAHYDNEAMRIKLEIRHVLTATSEPDELP